MMNDLPLPAFAGHAASVFVLTKYLLAQLLVWPSATAVHPRLQQCIHNIEKTASVARPFGPMDNIGIHEHQHGRSRAEGT